MLDADTRVVKNHPNKLLLKCFLLPNTMATEVNARDLDFMLHRLTNLTGHAVMMLM